MDAHEIKTAINETLTGEAADWWNGASRDIINEMIIYAQRHGLDAAIAEITELATEPAE